MAAIASRTHLRSARLIFIPILIGMATSQIIATLFVYLSNSRILKVADAISEAGLLPIPTGPVKATLTDIGPAFWGGLFFTLSVGIGLTLVSWAFMRLWDFVFRRHPVVLAGYGVIWATLLVLVNIKGVALFPTLFFLLVPLATAAAVFRTLRAPASSRSMSWFIPPISLLILTALWTTQLNAHLFTTIRDHILLSNPVGRSVNDFYYRYTLYAAESFKSFNQKTVRIGRMDGIPDERSGRRLRTLLARHDVLILEAFDRPDVVLEFSKKGVVLKSADNREIRTDTRQFISDPRTWLRSYSDATDRLAPFRKMTLAGLFVGFPVLLFVLVYGILRTVVGCWVEEYRTAWITSAVCLGIGMLLFLPMLSARPLQLTNEGLHQALISDQWTRRVAALRHIEARKLDIARYPSYQHLLASPMVVERYWLARAMAGSRSPATYPQLLTLLDDAHPNVQCQAFYALGARGQRMAINPIMERLVRTGHWYAQWYGYRALRRLGWYQVPSR